MEAAKNFIKSAVGILLVVAICFAAVTLYKKGSDSINASMKEYDVLISGLENSELTKFENATVQGSQVIEFLKELKQDYGVTVLVSNGYIVKNNKQNTSFR